MISDELISVGNKRMKSSGFVADVANDNLAICPEQLFENLVVDFTLQLRRHFH